MSFSQIFPIKDNTIYSDKPSQNTGIDPILELSKPLPFYSSRMLIQFDTNEINNIITNTTPGWKAYLKIYASEVESLPTDIDILCDPIYQEWDMGFGRRGNDPMTIVGSSWVKPKEGTIWMTSSLSTYSPFSGSEGGGSWYTGYTVSQSMNYYTDNDIYLDVTNQITDINNGTIPNNGFILRVSESVEKNEKYQYKLTYFSRDTNTIYAPSLIFYWDDQVYNPNTSSILNNHSFDISLENNTGVFQADDNVLFRVYARDKYPQRTFVTQSLYSYTKVLPSSSYYQVVDVDTNEAVIPFNDLGTLISADQTGSYFSLNMDTLEPERYYSIQIKTTIGNNTYVKNNDRMVFKVQQKV